MVVVAGGDASSWIPGYPVKRYFCYHKMATQFYDFLPCEFYDWRCGNVYYAPGFTVFSRMISLIFWFRRGFGDKAVTYGYDK